MRKAAAGHHTPPRTSAALAGHSKSPPTETGDPSLRAFASFCHGRRKCAALGTASPHEVPERVDEALAMELQQRRGGESDKNRKERRRVDASVVTLQRSSQRRRSGKRG